MAVKWQSFPDTEAMCARAMRDAGICGGRVYSSVPRNPTYPLATVKRLGGIPAVERALDSARIQVDIWGNNKSEARLACDASRVALHNMEGTIFLNERGFVSGVEDELGMIFVPDPETARDRYIIGVRVYAHSIVT